MSELERRTHDEAGNKYGELLPTPPTPETCPACKGTAEAPRSVTKLGPPPRGKSLASCPIHSTHRLVWPN